MIEVGNKAPDFTLPDTSRALKSLSELRGAKTVLAFFPGAFTGVCEKEMCTLRDSMSEFGQMDANVVAVSVDAPFSNGAFAQKNGLEFPLLSDYKRQVVNTYGIALENFAGLDGYVAAKRSVFVLDADGVVRYKWVSDNPGVEPDYPAIKEALAKM